MIRKPIDTSTIPDTWRILLTGVTSIHGWPIYKELAARLPNDRLYAIRPPKMRIPKANNVASHCITDTITLRRIRDDFQPTHVIHCAGVCDLDVCEERPQWAYEMNVNGSRLVAEVFGDNAIIYYMSTDLVFSGINPPAGGYAEHHEPNPISVAGRTYAEAEAQVQQCPEHCIIRLALPLGDSVTGDKGAVDWIESRFKKHRFVTLFYDEYRSCVTCDEIAHMTLQALAADLRGLYHFGDKTWSLYDIGQYVMDRGNYPAHLLVGRMRHEEVDGPPRIGDVSLNSEKIKKVLFQ